jgi:hypothetical protein
MRRQQSVASHLRTHLAITQDEMWEDREHRFARRTLYPPDGDATETDADIMRVTCETPAPAIGCLVLELKAKGHDEGDDTFEERLPIAKQLNVGRFAPEIDSNGAVFSRRLSRCAHVLPPCHQVLIS